MHKRSCPICQSVTVETVLERDGAVSCGKRFGVEGSASKIGQVVYFQCQTCQHIATDHFQEWSEAQFQTHIYNDEYVLFDPGYVETRPMAVAKAIAALSPLPKTVLDYGSGKGLIGTYLSELSIAVDSFDPMQGDIAPQYKAYDLVLCIEVLEHCPDPKAVAQILQDYTAIEGGGVVTTLLLPEASEHDFWWLGPRNGHIHAFSKESIQMIFPNLRSYGPGIHYWGTVPESFLAGIEAAILSQR